MTVDKLSDYGSSFQIKVISSLLMDVNYLIQVSDILLPEYFDNEGNRYIISKILEYYTEYNKAPTADAMKIYLEKITNEQLKESVRINLLESYKMMESDDLKIIRDETITFCKNQVLKQAILDSVDLLQIGKYDEIQEIIKKAGQAGTDKNLGHDYKKDIDSRYAVDLRNPIPTPWPIINDVTQGGPGAGELWIFVGKPGGGKSWTMINMAAHSMTLGKNVIYYTLELSAQYVAKRFDTYFSGIPVEQLTKYKDDIKIKLKDIPGMLIIKEYPAGSASMNTLIAHIEKTRAIEFEPDEVFIDYLDLMKAINVGKNKRDDQILGQLYIEAKGEIAQKYNIPCISVSQGNRGSADEQDIIQDKSISGAWEKLFHADFVMSQNRTNKDKISKTGKGHIIKSRVGPDGMSYPMSIDLKYGQIQVYDEESEEGQEIELNRQTGKIVEQHNQNNSKKVNSLFQMHQKIQSKF